MRITGTIRRTVEFDTVEDAVSWAKGDKWTARGAQLQKHKKYAEEYSSRIHSSQSGFILGTYGLPGDWWMNATTHPNVDSFCSRYSCARGEIAEIEAQTVRRRRRYSDEDGEFIEEREASDYPFESFDHVKVGGWRGRMDLLCEYGACADYDNHQIENSGIATCALADMLEDSGYRVRIIAVNFSYDVSPDNCECWRSIQLKQYEEPLDIGRIGLVLGCGPWYRTVGFLLKNKTAHQICKNFGRSAPVDISELSHLDLSEHRILVPRMQHESEALDFVMKHVKQTTAEAA